MPPKNKGKKGKKGQDDDDEYWEKKAAEIDQKNAEIAATPDDGPSGGGGGFAALDDDEDEGGLMSMINKASKTKKKSKKKKGRADSDDEEVNGDAVPPPPADTTVNMDDEWPEEDVKPKKGKKGKKGAKMVEEDDIREPEPEAEAAPAPVTEVNIDDEWPEEDLKPKKGKKGKKGVIAKKDEEDEVPESSAADAPQPAEKPDEPEAAAPESDEEDDGPKILSKKEKEKLKKERERAKKKAQAAGKKSTPAAAPSQQETTPTDTAATLAALPKGKKVPAHIAAMRAAMEEKARVEEELRKAEEERQRKIDEEEARLAAEEQRLADQKAAKKLKEKEKAARLKAEGKLLTPAQKREKEIAEKKKQAMLDSGMIVAGLQGGEERKKPVYGKKKGKGPTKPAVKEDVQEKEPEPEPTPEQAVAAAESDDDWDQEDKDTTEVDDLVNGVGKVKINDVDDWDQSEDEGEAEPKAAAPVAKAKAAPNPVASTSSKSAVSKPTAKPAANGAAPPDEEEDDEDESSDDDDSSEMDSEDEFEARKEAALARIEARRKRAQESRSADDLRSPISVMLGHVDHGKTLLLDSIRKSSVAAGEAGGITQQIGSTFVPREALIEKTARVNKDGMEIKTGLLILDTPGHASFSNLRSRGSSLTDIAILVIDITQGFQPTSLEALDLLRTQKIPFIVAVNKIDRLYGWKSIPNAGFRESYETQPQSSKNDFEDRIKKIKLAFSEQGFNSEIFDRNTSLARTISLVPTSAVTGEGLPDLILLMIRLNQERLIERLKFGEELAATVLEVKQIEGLGTTIDVIVTDGILRENDRIVLCGMDGPIATNVRALLAPQPLKELRVKSQYQTLKEVKASLGIRISAVGLDKAVGGAKLYVVKGKEDQEAEEAVYKELAMEDVTNLKRYSSKGPGIYVTASTLGSLEALLSFLQAEKIKVHDFGLGTVRKAAVRSASRMVDSHPDCAIIMAFDVPIDPAAQAEATAAGVTIFSEDVIYHLLDKFIAFKKDFDESKRAAALPNAVWPVRLKILAAFAHRDPIILGAEVVDGACRIGTPLGVVRPVKDGPPEIVRLGKVSSMEINHRSIDTPVRRQQAGAGIAIKIEKAPHESAKLYGRHFNESDQVVSLLSRTSIDTLKASFRDQVDKSDWLLIKQMKIEQGIP